MKALIITLLFSFSFAYAALERTVIIKGVIGSSFDDEKVKIKDSLDQSYYLPRRLFPKDFKPQQGKIFYMEVDEKELDKIKILKKR